MNLSPKSPVLLLALLCATASLGQDSAAPPRAPAPAAEAETEAEAEDEAPPPAERPEVNDDEFIPTEELAPDAAITFPVDI